jgi:hypothetical protein
MAVAISPSYSGEHIFGSTNMILFMSSECTLKVVAKN